MKKYEKPDLEVISLRAEDIVITSPGSVQQNNQTNPELDGPWA